MKKLAVLACVAMMGMSGAAMAANANHPYQNCDRRNDNCGPTGDDQTDRLNQQQLGGAPLSAAPGPDAMAPAPAPQQ